MAYLHLRGGGAGGGRQAVGAARAAGAVLLQRVADALQAGGHRLAALGRKRLHHLAHLLQQLGL